MLTYASKTEEDWQRVALLPLNAYRKASYRDREKL